MKIGNGVMQTLAGLMGGLEYEHRYEVRFDGGDAGFDTYEEAEKCFNSLPVDKHKFLWDCAHGELLDENYPENENDDLPFSLNPKRGKKSK